MCKTLLLLYTNSRLLPVFQCSTRKTREPGKTYHVSDIVGGTDLQVMQVEPSQVSSICYAIRVISFTRLPCFSCATLKNWWVPDYQNRALLTESTE